MTNDGDFEKENAMAHARPHYFFLKITRWVCYNEGNINAIWVIIVYGLRTAIPMRGITRWMSKRMDFS
jgi:hypothetical protein